MSTPLNPLLYSQLHKRFGHVRISNEGESLVGRYVHDVLTDRDSLLITNSGEYYHVCCPFCNDTRSRLCINHSWGVRDERGNKRLWLACCYNENCLSDPMNRDTLLNDLAYVPGRVAKADLRPGKIVKRSTVSELPGPLQRLDTLPPLHPANRYMDWRGFKSELLGKFYGVGYCPDSRFELARGRIIVPIYLGRTLRGWQARRIGDDPEGRSTPKWWSDPNMQKRFLLYNIGNAKRFRTGVVLEGPGKVWNFGPMGMATLGSSMSEYQVRDLIGAFRDQSLVLLWDADVQHDPGKMKHVLKVQAMLKNQFRRGFATVWPPDGIDPDSVDRHELRRYVAKEAKAQGVTVDWRMR